MNLHSLVLLPLACFVVGSRISAQQFLLPTSNSAIFESGGEERFFAGTVGKPWTSGTFGCVRSDGWQLHEGLDIRAVGRNPRGEPTDSVSATADGTVAYVNLAPSLSNYGIYVILRHQIQGMEVYSLYAHLHAVSKELKPGTAIRAGQPIATMGRTTNTRQGISKDRAHVHFEIDLILNDRFSQWYRKTRLGQRNDHGDWNGQNFVGLDARQLLISQRELGSAFSLKDFVQRQTELCRVQLRVKSFSWLKRYPALVTPNPLAETSGIAGYEIALNYVGVPFEVIPRAASELKSKSIVHLLSVNAEEYRTRPCRKLVSNRGGRWQLANNGQQLIDLLIY